MLGLRSSGVSAPSSSKNLAAPLLKVSRRAAPTCSLRRCSGMDGSLAAKMAASSASTASSLIAVAEGGGGVAVCSAAVSAITRLKIILQVEGLIVVFPCVFAGKHV